MGKKRKELEKIMLDYIRWIFKLDFCTPRYLLSRQLDIEKLRIKWGIRARRFEGRIKGMDESRWLRKCRGKKR